MTDAQRKQRFFFAHVQKAAGTSFYIRLQRHFSRSQIYPDASDKVDPPAPILLVSHLVRRYALRRNEIRVVTGHFPIRTTELLGDPFITMTLLRDPVERTMSFLRHYRKLALEDGDRPLEAIYEDPIRFHGLIHNHMTKMFSLSPDEMMAGDGVMTHVEVFSNERLAAAKQALERVDVLGLHDQFDDFCDQLALRFGWRLGASLHTNRTEPIPISSSFRDRIARDNAMDIELFEYGRTLYRQRSQSHGRRT